MMGPKCRVGIPIGQLQPVAVIGCMKGIFDYPADIKSAFTFAVMKRHSVMPTHVANQAASYRRETRLGKQHRHLVLLLGQALEPL